VQDLVAVAGPDKGEQLSGRVIHVGGRGTRATASAALDARLQTCIADRRREDLVEEAAITAGG
jgi:hypothetical protein